MGGLWRGGHEDGTTVGVLMGTTKPIWAERKHSSTWATDWRILLFRYNVGGRNCGKYLESVDKVLAIEAEYNAMFSFGNVHLMVSPLYDR